MSSRSLDFHQLQQFKEFLVRRGWVEETPKESELLRMRHKRERDPVILHASEKDISLWGISAKLASAFVRSNAGSRK